MEGKPIDLTPAEIEGLEQVISAGHKWMDGSNPAYPALILKIGRAFLNAQREGISQELYLSEVEAWYLREIVPTNMRVRSEGVGIAIKSKLYPILLDFEAEKYSQAAGKRYGFSPTEEPLTKKDALVERNEQSEEPATEHGDDSVDALAEQNEQFEEPATEQSDDSVGTIVTPDVQSQNDLDSAQDAEEGVEEAEPNREQPAS